MKRTLGLVLMLCGLACLLASGGLLWHNAREDDLAGGAAQAMLQQLEVQLAASPEAVPLTEEISTEMTIREVDGLPCIGYLSLPSIERELPILAEWDYPKLKKAPCRYMGSTHTNDLIIAAHNYKRHFGLLTQLAPGNPVYFTDMDGVVTEYEVTDTELLLGTDVDKMVESDADLTLFTCTYGGKKRVTVRCVRVY